VGRNSVELDLVSEIAFVSGIPVFGYDYDFYCYIDVNPTNSQ